MGVTDISHERSKRAKERIERLRKAIVVELEAVPTVQAIETFVDTGSNLGIRVPAWIPARPGDYWLVFRSPSSGDVCVHQKSVAGLLLVIRSYRLANPTAAFSMRDIATMVDKTKSPDGAPTYHFTEFDMNEKQFETFMADQQGKHKELMSVMKGRRFSPATVAAWALVVVSLFGIGVAIWTVLHNDHYAEESGRFTRIDNRIASLAATASSASRTAASDHQMLAYIQNQTRDISQTQKEILSRLPAGKGGQ